MTHLKEKQRPQTVRLHIAITAMWLLLAQSCASPHQQIDAAPTSSVPQQAPQPAFTPSPSAAAHSTQFTSAEAQTIAVADELIARTPRARKSVATEGLLPSNPVSKASRFARADWYGMLALAQAATITGQSRYANALDTYFAAWTAVYEPQGNPINESHFLELIMAYEIGGQYLSPPTRAQTIHLFQRMVDVTFDRKRVLPGTERNNWQSHRVMLATALAFVLQDPVLISMTQGAFKQQVSRNIGADGEVLDFKQRDALHYVVYSLKPLLIAALIARQHGEDWYHFQARSGASLTAALQWLAPYADGDKTHVEFQNTTIPFDRERAQAGVPGFTGLWNPAEAVDCYQLAARLDAKWIARAVRLGRAPPWMQLAYPSPLIDAAQIGLPLTAAPPDSSQP